MNALRSLVRDVVNLVGSEVTKQPTEVGLRKALEQRVVPPVINLGRYRDSFDQTTQRPFDAPAPKQGKVAKQAWRALSVSAPAEHFTGVATASSFSPHADGFEMARRAPVDLLGRSAATILTPSLPKRGAKRFTASLADL